MSNGTTLTLTVRSGTDILILRWPNSDMGIMGASEAIADWYRKDLLDMNDCMVFAQTARKLMDDADKMTSLL